MGVVKSKYWRKKKTLSNKCGSASNNTNIAPRVAPLSNEDQNPNKSIIENILSHENYEYVAHDNVCLIIRYLSFY